MSAGGHVLTDAELHARLEKAYRDGDRDGADLERASILMYLQTRIDSFAKLGHQPQAMALRYIALDLRRGAHRVGDNAELWR